MHNITQAVFVDDVSTVSERKFKNRLDFPVHSGTDRLASGPSAERERDAKRMRNGVLYQKTKPDTTASPHH
jgi:hypothetical protein